MLDVFRQILHLLYQDHKITKNFTTLANYYPNITIKTLSINIKNTSLKLMMKKVYYETMLSYCLKCRKNTESRNPMVEKTKRGIFLSCCAVCGSKKSKYIRKQKGF